MSDSGASSPKVCVVPARPVGAQQITLQVGERRFVTRHDTLTQESGFFSSLLSGRWENAEADGPYFIDADGDLFVHILRYLRRGVLPLFYDNSKGHDHALYLALLVDARYFQIPRLEAWIKDKRYLHMVKLEYSAEDVEGVYKITETTKSCVDIQHHPQLEIQKVYLCPRDIFAHRGNPQACGKQCRKVQGEAENVYDDEHIWTTTIIRKRVVVDQHLCIDDQESQSHV